VTGSTRTTTPRASAVRGVLSVCCLVAVLVATLVACSDGGSGGDDGADERTVADEQRFCARAERLATARRHPAVRAQARALRRTPAPTSLTDDARAGRRVLLAILREATSRDDVRRDLRAQRRDRLRQVLAFQAYVASTCRAGLLDGMMPSAAPTRSPSETTGELSTGPATVLPTDLPTDIFTELSEFPTDGGQPGNEEPEACLSIP